MHQKLRPEYALRTNAVHRTRTVCLAAAIGQSLIPLPVLGAAMGAAAGRLLVFLAKDEPGLAQALEARFARVVSALDNELQVAVSALMVRFDELGELSKAAFDLDRNVRLRLQSSIRLAETCGVAPARVVRNVSELDRFMG